MKFRKTALIVLFLSMILLSAVTVYASGGGEDSPWTASKLIGRVINTIVLIGVLWYVLKKPLSTFFSERKDQIQKDLEEAKAQREKAERTIEEYRQKIAGMEHELEKMRDELKKSAETESQKVEANAERMAVSMVEAAKLAAEQEVRKAKIALKNESVELAVEMAESLIREKIGEDDRKRIVEDYLVKVGGMK